MSSMDREIFMPFHEVFKNFDREEKEHIHWLLCRLKTASNNYKYVKSNKAREERDALYWVLTVLKDLEQEE